MAQKVDFEELKALISVTDVAAWCGIKVKQTGDTFRGDCGLCGAERSFTLTPAKGMWGCFKCQKRGSIIDMVFHFKQTANVRDAGLLLKQHFLSDGTVPAKEDSPLASGNSTPDITSTRPKSGQTSEQSDLSTKLAKVREKLLYGHEAIQAIGLTPEVARAFDIGYCPSGIMRGRIVSPMYLDGVHVAYKGLATTAEQSPLMLFPSNLEQIVVAPKVEAKPQPDDVRNFLRVVK